MSEYANMSSIRYAQRKPRTIDPDQRLLLANAEIARLEKLVLEREALLGKAEALASIRKQALESTSKKLNAVREKRDRIISLKERRAKKPLPAMDATKALERAELFELREKLKKYGKSIDEVLEALK